MSSFHVRRWVLDFDKVSEMEERGPGAGVRSTLRAHPRFCCPSCRGCVLHGLLVVVHVTCVSVLDIMLAAAHSRHAELRPVNLECLRS